MTSHYPIYAVNCVFLAKMNPAMFHPSWLSHNDLVRDAEAANATVHIVHEDVAAFQVSNISFSVDSTKLTLETVDQSKFEVMRDMAIGIFTLLEATPVQYVGINTMIHYALPSREQLDRFGHQIAPKEPLWNSILDNPGTLRLVVQGKNPLTEKGFISVYIEPSTKVVNGVHVLINYHFDVSSSKNASSAVATIRNHFDNALRESLKKIEAIVDCSKRS